MRSTDPTAPQHPVPPVSGHTEGPWRVGEPEPDDYRTPIIAVAHDYELHSVASAFYADDADKAEWLANARLIAAAPDLLAVVERGRQKLATYVSVYPGDKELRGLLEAWDAAISKAQPQDNGREG